MSDQGRWAPTFRTSPRDWAPHPRKRMLMTPSLVFWGGLYAFGVTTLVAAFFQVFFFHPPLSNDWAPLSDPAMIGRHVFVSNGCVYCHSGYTRPEDVRQDLYYLYPRISLPGDYVSTDTSPNVFGSARIGPDLSQEAGFHPTDWQYAHFSDPRFVSPNSIMPRFDFLSDRETGNLVFFLERRSGKSGLVRAAGQRYMKILELIVNGMPPPPAPSEARKLTQTDVARMFIMGQVDKSKLLAPAPSGAYEGLPWPDPIELNTDDRAYWLASNPMPVTTWNLQRGRLLFQSFCIGCHGQGGAGVSPAAQFLRPPPANFTDPDAAASDPAASPGDWYYRILRGVPGTAMEDFGTRLHVADIWRVVLFLKTIPNGGLAVNQLPTPDLYIQWAPSPGLLAYLKTHPMEQNYEFVAGQAQSGGDPWFLEARRVLPGLSVNDRIMVPGYGEVSLKAARDGIRRIYDQMLTEGWHDYLARGERPIPPPGQKEIPPDLGRELR